MLNIITLLLNNHIVHNLKEKKFSEVFAKFYLHEKIMNWCYSSSKKSGASSDSKTLEICNNTGELVSCVIFNCASKKLLFFEKF